SGMLMIMVMGTALATGQLEAWSSRKLTLGLERSGWNEDTSLANGCFSPTGSTLRAKSFMASTVRSPSRWITPTSNFSNRYKGELVAAWVSIGGLLAGLWCAG